MQEALGMAYAVLLLVLTAVSWQRLFESLFHGLVAVLLWILILSTGPMGGFFGLILVGWIFYLHHEWILSWVYSFTPHPAERLVDQALSRDGSLDVDAFSKAIHESVGENDFERAARAKQVNNMTLRWRRHEEVLRQREAQLNDVERRAMEKKNELVRAQTQALEAAVAHQRAAARYEELQRVRQSDDG